MCIEIMEYFAEKLGDKEELQLGKYLTCWLDICGARIRIGFSLNDELESKLYDEVFGSHSTIYTWTKDNLLPLLSLVANKYLDFEGTIDFFERVGTEDDRCCDECNGAFVIPGRMYRMAKAKAKK